jgi:hypothetical protein
MKRIVILIAVVAFAAAAGSAAVASVPTKPRPTWAPGSRYGGPSIVAGVTSAKAAAHPRTRSLASAYVRCHPTYSTSVYAAVWPTNGPPWTETFCVREDTSIAGQLYYDDDFFYWSGSQWVMYGTWAEHVTFSWGSLSTYVDYCYWHDSRGMFGPFYSGCP